MINKSNQEIPKDKTNKAFMILSALGIIFVLDAHVWSRMAFFTQIFPYDSFFMPMFVFISGYFFKEKYIESFNSVLAFVKNKFQKLMIPYIGWIIFYGIFTTILTNCGILNFQKAEIFPLIKTIIVQGSSFGFNSPSWFVPLLFYVSVSYIIIRKVFEKHWNEPLAMLILFLFGTVAVYFSSTYKLTAVIMLVAKLLFFLQFYELGIFFKKHLEKIFDKANFITVVALCISINIILLSIYDVKINFPNCSYMGGFRTNNVVLPMITTLTGTAFWLKVSKTLVPAIGNSKLVNYISNNTFFIMTNHLTIKALFNGLLIIGKKYGINQLQSVDALQFKSSAWYVYTDYDWIWSACFFFTLAGTLAFCFIYTKGKQHFKTIFKKLISNTNKTTDI